ncbi:hypothetical protein WMY93_017093 [Mugilogobius chulae]|uniref:Cadherin domain-containing protein n=1 Tax=Mugilogobius chulae TaxID=88201 RepID=A0AAW0NMN4_9GOBI
MEQLRAFNYSCISQDEPNQSARSEPANQQPAPPGYQRCNGLQVFWPGCLAQISVRVTATDADTGSFGSLSYSLSSSSPLFSIHTGTGQICTTAPLDRDQGPSSYDLTVTAQDGGGLSSVAYVRVDVDDINDNAPNFYPLTYAVSLSTQSTPGTSVVKVTAHDPDSGEHGRVTYRTVPGGASPYFTLNKDTGTSQDISYTISTGDPAGYFTVDPGSGALRTNRSLDHEAQPSLDLEIQARSGNPPAFGQTRVHVTISDVNDNPPTFLPSSSESLLLPEHTEIGSVVYRVLAEDIDSDANGHVTFELTSPIGIQRTFSLDRGTGEIRLVGNLNFDTIPRYDLQVVAKDSGAPQLSATFMLLVHVQAENDHGPVFDTLTYRVELREGTPINTRFLQVRALNRESPSSGFYSPLSYHLRPDGDAAGFGIAADSGWLFVKSAVDREAKDMYLLTFTQERVFMAVRENLPAGTGFGHVTASDRDSGANGRLSYRLMHPDKHFQINPHTGDRGLASGALLSTLQAKDPDEGENGTVFYSLSGPRAERFSLHPTTGELRSSSPLLHSDRAEYSLTATATDHGSPALSSSCPIVVQILGANRPSMKTSSYSLTFNSVEETKPGSVIGTIRLPDQDTPPLQGEVTYTLVGGTDRDGTFMLDRQTGDVYLARPLDYEKDPRYTLQIEVDDFSQTPPTSTMVQLDIDIEDSNDHAPKFPEDPITIVVSENAKVGSSIYTFQAVDKDGSGPNSELSYSILHQWPNNLLKLDATSGVLYLGRELDREVTSNLVLVVKATDQATDVTQRRWGSVTVRVYVTDENDNAPMFSSPNAVSVMEDQPVGFVVLYVMARDPDQGDNGRVSYSIQDGNSGGMFSLNPTTVKIRVLDENDHAPVFGRLFYSIEVPENMEPQPLFTLRATDQDSGPRGDISYRIIAGDPSGDFHLERLSGVLSTSRPLDRERKSGYTLTVSASDQGTPPLSSTVSVEITVLDLNDHSPQFESQSYTSDISEDLPIGSLVVDVKAIDLDEGVNSQIMYFLSQGSKSMFIIDQNTGRIITAAPLDREKVSSYTFDVYAIDSSPANPRNSTAQVTVYIQDVNDNAPYFIQDPLILNISVNSVSNRRVLATMKAEDKDFGANGSVFYRFANPVRGFTINSLTGDIQVTEKLQSLTQSQRTLIVQAMDQGNPAQSSLGVVVVYVREQEYRGIKFSRNARDVSLQENAAQGTVVTQTQAQYPDGSQNGISYSLFSGNTRSSFGINPITGEIWVQKSEGLDFEENPRIRLVVKAETASSSSYMAVNLILQDVNDNLPRFQLQNYVAYIREAQGYDFPIIQVSAEDLDQGQNGQVTYSLRSSSMSALFKIDPTTGSISTAAIMDREIWTQTKLVVTATDRGTPRLAGSATLTVIIVDLNDNSPMIPVPRELRVPEDTMIGTIITMVTGNDVDSGPALSYSLRLDADTQGLFGIHRYGGGVSLTGPLDYEARSWYTLTIRSSDSKHHSEANLTVLVEDVNDNSPVFTQDLYQVTVAEHLPAGSVVVTVTATDRDSGDNGRVTYRVVSSTGGAFYMDPNNGTLFVNQKTEFDFENPSILVLVEARDHGTPSLSSVATIQVYVSDINDNAPIFHQSEYRATMSEDNLPGSTILTLEAMDGDLSRDNCGYDFAIASGNSGNAFQIESSVRFLEGKGFQTVGSIILVEELDFEAVPKYNLPSSVPIIISITDANDNPPAFSRSEYNIVLSEGAAAGTEILHLSANDPDSAPNGEVIFSISSGDENELFQVDMWTGALKLRKTLSGDSQSSHLIVVQASDNQDINDNRPFFPLKHITASIKENQPKNALVTILHAIDHDRGLYGRLKYFIVDHSKEGENTFLINQTTGEIRTRSTFDFEKFLFEVPDGARKGQVIGRVQAKDEDGGVDGIVLYSMLDTSPYFEVNKSNGEISLKMDSYSRQVSRSKREVRQMTLEVTAHTKVIVDVTHTAFGIPTDMNTVLVSVIAVSLGTIVILILIAVALFFVKLRRQRNTMMHRFEETKIAANEIIYHQALPGYTTESSNNAGPFGRGGSLDPSHSSGRGSAEAEAAEDDEIRMINEYPRVSSISSSMQERISARGPDSGIQQDADQLSDVSCEPSIDASGWFKKKNGSLNGSIMSGSMYRDDASSYVSVGRGLSISHPKDYTFPRTFQPLASVFTEIARLKDETVPHHSRRHFLHKAKLTESRIDPPPLITSVAHPGAKTVPPKPAVGRTYPHLGLFGGPPKRPGIYLISRYVAKLFSIPVSSRSTLSSSHTIQRLTGTVSVGH